MNNLDEHFLDVRDEDTKEYLNFIPVWNDGWKLKSVRTGAEYLPESFLSYNETSSFKSYYDEYSEQVKLNSSYEVSPVFMFVWLKKFLMYKAMEHREGLRTSYLKSNLVSGLTPKEVMKINKNSEKLYESGYSKYFEYLLTL